MSQRQAVTKVKTRAYAHADRATKTAILDELVELTGWHRNYARTALREALRLKVVKPSTVIKSCWRSVPPTWRRGSCRAFRSAAAAAVTVIDDSLGSRSQLYSLVALATLVVTLLFFLPVLAAFPTAALGAIVVYAVTRLIDVAEFLGTAAR